MPSGKTSRVAGLKNCSSHKAIEAAHRYRGKDKRQGHSSNKMYIEVSNAIPENWNCTLSHRSHRSGGGSSEASSGSYDSQEDSYEDGNGNSYEDSYEDNYEGRYEDSYEDSYENSYENSYEDSYDSFESGSGYNSCEPSSGDKDVESSSNGAEEDSPWRYENIDRYNTSLFQWWD